MGETWMSGTAYRFLDQRAKIAHRANMYHLVRIQFAVVQITQTDAERKQVGRVGTQVIDQARLQFEPLRGNLEMLGDALDDFGLVDSPWCRLVHGSARRVEPMLPPCSVSTVVKTRLTFVAEDSCAVFKPSNGAPSSMPS